MTDAGAPPGPSVLRPVLGPTPGGTDPFRAPFATAAPVRRGVGTAAAVLGLVSTATWLLPLLGVAVSAAALVLARVAGSRARRLEGVAGTPRVGTSLSLVTLFLAVAVTALALLHQSELARFQRCAAVAVTRAEQDACLDQLGREVQR